MKIYSAGSRQQVRGRQDKPQALGLGARSSVRGQPPGARACAGQSLRPVFPRSATAARRTQRLFLCFQRLPHARLPLQPAHLPLPGRTGHAPTLPAPPQPAPRTAMERIEGAAVGPCASSPYLQPLRLHYGQVSPCARPPRAPAIPVPPGLRASPAHPSGPAHPALLSTRPRSPGSLVAGSGRGGQNGSCRWWVPGQDGVGGQKAQGRDPV